MKKITYSFIVLSILISASCNKGDVQDNNIEGSFGFSIIDSGSDLKNGNLLDSLIALDNVKSILLTIESSFGESTNYNLEEIQIYKMGESYVSQKLTLPVGDYKLTEFFLIDEARNVIYAAPLNGSQQTQNVDNPLPIDFNVAEDQITAIPVEVISTDGLTPDQFGLVGFSFTEVPVFSFLINVSKQGYLDSLLTASLTIATGEYTYYQNLTPNGFNIVAVKDEYLEYKLTVSNPSYYDFVKVFSKDNLKQYSETPLTVELIKKENSNSIALFSSEGKDVQIFSADPTGTVDRGTVRRDIVISEWTKNGIPTTKYALLDFDFSSIPDGTVISEARLSLFHDPNSIDMGHSQMSGSNDAYIQRITSDWVENLSWNDQPTTIETNRIHIPASINDTIDYPNIDVTLLTQDIINDKANSFGYLIKLASTEYYRSLVFASGENPDSNLHPKLEIWFNTK